MDARTFAEQSADLYLRIWVERVSGYTMKAEEIAKVVRPNAIDVAEMAALYAVSEGRDLYTTIIDALGVASQDWFDDYMLGHVSCER